MASNEWGSLYYASLEVSMNKIPFCKNICVQNVDDQTAEFAIDQNSYWRNHQNLICEKKESRLCE